MSLKAFTWAIKHAPPMPPQHLATLLGLAEHTDNNGRGAYPSIATLAAYTCKSERSVQRDIKALLDLGLIRLGNQTLASRLPAGKRPEVYDLALEEVVPGGRAGDDEVTQASRVTLTSSRARGGKRKPKSDAFSTSETGDAHVTPDVHVTGDAHVADGVTPTSPEGRRPRHPNQNQNHNQNPLHPRADEHAADDEQRRNAFQYCQPLITAMTDAGVRVSWQLQAADWQDIARVLDRAGLDAMVEHARAAKASTRQPIGYARFFLRGWKGLPPKSTRTQDVPAQKPPHCGHVDCDENTRLRDAHDAKGFPIVVPCPECHPNTRKDVAA